MGTEKRKAEDNAEQETKKAKGVSLKVNSKRLRELKGGEMKEGPVIYWMSRDQRAADNWALLFASELADRTSSPMAVAFNLVPAFLGAGARQFCFMLRGLQELEQKLKELNIPFFLTKGDPCDTMPKLVEDTSAAALVTDFSPLRLGREWRQGVMEKLNVPFVEVDAHNVVPVWEASDKREVGARTIRTKIHKKLTEFLKEFPEVPVQPEWTGMAPEPIDWEELIAEVTSRGSEVPEVKWIKPGEQAAQLALSEFLSKSRLGMYDRVRNDPTAGNALSGLSPYLHFGQLAPQRAAIEAAKHKATNKAAVESYLEELIIRRELSDNYCYYEPNYDNLQGAAGWAQETLRVHAKDKREHIYTKEQLEKGKTHDALWNAAQLEMVYYGKMHGFMRMYWAKKILEWTASPEEALEISIYLNDKYELDGRDPSGYVGCMWSIAGVHDQGWGERAVFGKIRYMNYNGCKRKFNIDGYVNRINKLVQDIKAGKK